MSDAQEKERLEVVSQRAARAEAELADLKRRFALVVADRNRLAAELLERDELIARGVLPKEVR